MQRLPGHRHDVRGTGGQHPVGSMPGNKKIYNAYCAYTLCSNKAGDDSLLEQHISTTKIEIVLIQKPSKYFAIKSDFFQHHKI